MGRPIRRPRRLVTLEILEPGPLTTVQDPFGRPRWRHVGVPVGGAADPWASRLANRLVGNPDEAALLEIALGGALVGVDRPSWLALTGGLRAEAGGIELPIHEAWHLRPGGSARIQAAEGARGYLAIGGGLVVEAVLGSVATDLRAGFGGLEGRALRAGDRLEVGVMTGRPVRWTGRASTGPIRIVAGPHPEALRDLLATWTVAVEADRTGVRLDGPRIEGGEAPSMALPLGAIQVPPDGRPIVMLADRPVTGGYRVPASVIRADIGRVAQLWTGDELTFVSVTAGEAIAALRQAEEELARIEPIEVGDDDVLAWAGSHE
jgi:5-oxoprolinase (ATP-hydrolysing) subunit C